MSNQVRVFLTAADFANWFGATYPKAEDNNLSDLEYAAWAICLQEAHSIFDQPIAHVASLFMEGIVAYKLNPEVAIQDWLDTVNAELIEAIEVGDVRLKDGCFIHQDDADTYEVINVEVCIAEDYTQRSLFSQLAIACQ